MSGSDTILKDKAKPVADEGGEQSRARLSASDIRHNMIFIVMLDAIFTMGASDLQLVAGPLWDYLKASNTIIGFTASLQITALLGVVLSPFISVRFKFKKWYLFVSHIPYIGAWGLLGLMLVLSRHLDLYNDLLLPIVVVMLGANHFFGGFVGLPHQEYIVGCIPMSHRGRYTGYSYSIGSALSIVTMAAGGLILQYCAKPSAYGYLFLMTWFFCQGGYVLALFGRERPVPVEKAPKPWSRRMFKVAWDDKKFLRILLLNAILTGVFFPTFFIFVPQYGFRAMGMAHALAAVIGMVTLWARIGLSSPIGHLTDRLSPKHVLPFSPLIATVGLVSALILHNQLGVYIAAAAGAAMTVSVSAALNPLIYGIPSPENRSGHFTFQLILNYGVGALGPILIGVACDMAGYRTTFAALAVLGIIMLPVSRWLLKDLSADARNYQ